MNLHQPEASARVFLFLQGPSSPLFHMIAGHLEALGHKALRINICAGDRVFWRRKGAENFRGSLAEWPAFLERFMDRNRVSDIVLLGEERPHHKAAAEIAHARSIDVTAIEMGYLRPDWISVEAGGAGASSHFPDDRETILSAGANLPQPDFTVLYRHSFTVEVALDLAYNLPNVFLRFLHPYYRWHALQHPMAEYWSWIRSWSVRHRRNRETSRALQALSASGADFFLYPLQLQTDYQMRSHSPFNGQEEAVEMVLTAFARSADTRTHLLLKTHPLDNGLIDWAGVTQTIANKNEIADRVHIVFSGDLANLIECSRGVVTVNSTVGLQALMAGKPVSVLGTAIYDIERLTDRRPLSLFFSNPNPPDPLVSNSFVALIAAALHERGNFYSLTGARAGANAIALRLHEQRINKPDAFVAVPPRKRVEKYRQTPKS